MSDSTVFANFETSEGRFRIELFEDRVPKTVANFIDLATGVRSWKHPESGKVVEGRPYYDGQIFHRIIDGFMIQGGDPTGTGMGGPGYSFEDEFDPGLRHDRPGILSMANAGPNTNGSQFFITLAPTPHLDNRHAVFGAVVDGLDVVKKIGGVDTGPNDRPVKPVTIQKLTIERADA